MMEDLKINQTLVAVLFTIFTTCLFAGSFAALPPLGDARCQADSCQSVDCAKVSCSFGKLMIDPSSPCGCCQICINYYGKRIFKKIQKFLSTFSFTVYFRLANKKWMMEYLRDVFSKKIFEKIS